MLPKWNYLYLKGPGIDFPRFVQSESFFKQSEEANSHAIFCSESSMFLLLCIINTTLSFLYFTF